MSIANGDVHQSAPSPYAGLAADTRAALPAMPVEGRRIVAALLTRLLADVHVSLPAAELAASLERVGAQWFVTVTDVLERLDPFAADRLRAALWGQLRARYPASPTPLGLGEPTGPVRDPRDAA